MIPDEVPGPDPGAQEAARARADDILRPPGALARLDDVAVWMAGWQRRPDPRVEHPAVLVFAGDHGVVAEGVTSYPSDVTAAMLAAFEAGKATVTAMAAVAGASVHAVDVGVGRPTGNIAVEAALDADQLADAVGAGRQAVSAAVDDGADLLALGEMGIGNTTPAAALCAAVLGGPAADWVGRGAGLDNEGLARKQAVVARAVARAGDVSPDPARLLAELGGHELAAIAGAVLEARDRSVPVLLDGFICTAAALPLHHARPGILAHCRAAHRSAEPGHRLLLEAMGLDPLLDLDLRLGEASGAVAAIPLVAMACAAVTDVATFTEWMGP